MKQFQVKIGDGGWEPAIFGIVSFDFPDSWTEQSVKEWYEKMYKQPVEVREITK